MTLSCKAYYDELSNQTEIVVRETDPQVSLSFTAVVKGTVETANLKSKAIEWLVNKYVQTYDNQVTAQKVDEVKQSVDVIKETAQKAIDDVKQAVEETNKATEILKTLIKSIDLPEEAKKEIASQYPTYEVSHDYKVGDIFSYNNTLYEVIQEHRSQSDWLPDAVASLYKPLINATGTIKQADGTSAEIVVIDEFKQPTGAHDAYKKGDKVTFNGKVYESLADTNVYSPSDYPTNWMEVAG
ncbi:hypothetical protein VMHJH2_00160 [Streptococcus uberis]|uniref:carbohydrate-binding protein n=1 Tax=Streptococcus uberis TaxID=1349 RepID=UPI00214FD3E1|nr:carbohydrate-binding protein [Streptococcus uberis]MCR4256925.1 hypothetical protein [Streptococcus uberis]